MTKFFHALEHFILLAAGAIVIASGVLTVCGLQDSVGHADVGVVFGSRVRPDGQASSRLNARLDKAAELFQQGDFPLVMVSGGVGNEGFNEAQVMKAGLEARGVPESQIITDEHGRNTYDTASNLLHLVRARHLNSVFLVTQYFHMPRARLACHFFGLQTVYYAHADYFELRDLYSLPREVIGFLFYWIRPYSIGDS